MMGTCRTGAHPFVCVCLCACVQVLKDVLVDFSSIITAYSNQFDRPAPIVNLKEQLQQFYGFLCPTNHVIRVCQAQDYPTGGEGYWALLILRSTTLNIKTPLTMYDPHTEEPLVKVVEATDSDEEGSDEEQEEG
jgi:hypothetical protein